MGIRLNLAATSTLVATGIVRSVVKLWNPLDPVGSFFADLANALRDWYATMLVWLVDLITTVSVPTPEMLVNDFFSFALGGTYGLARTLVALIAVVIAVIIVLSPTARHGVKMQRVLTSALMVILLGWLFYPAYSLLYGLSKAGVDASKALVTTGDESVFDAVMRLFDAVNIADAINTIIATGISGVFGIFLAGTAVGLFLTTIFVMIGYPIAIAIRPLGAFGNTVFNLCNAAILTTLLSPMIMAFLFMAPLYAQKYMSGVAVVAAPFFAILGSLGALLTPYVIFFLAFKKSSEVFGRIDDASGRFDIGKMPSVSVEDVKNDVSVTNNMNTSAIIADTLGDSLLYGNGGGDMFDDIVKKGVDIGATAAAAAGHPYISVALKGAGGLYTNARENSSSQNESTQSQTQSAPQDPPTQGGGDSNA